MGSLALLTSFLQLLLTYLLQSYADGNLGKVVPGNGQSIKPFDRLHLIHYLLPEQEPLLARHPPPSERLRMISRHDFFDGKCDIDLSNSSHPVLKKELHAVTPVATRIYRFTARSIDVLQASVLAASKLNIHNW